MSCSLFSACFHIVPLSFCLDFLPSQARAEEAAGLPVAPFMQGLDSLATRAKLQHGFISFVLERWWRNVVRLFPALQPCWDHLMANKAHFARLMATTAPTTATTTTVSASKGDAK